nr:disulfide bond formation protein B [Salinibaculum sp. KK48]
MLRKQVTDSRVVFGVAGCIAVVATLGSLSYSNVLGFFPCELCWFQRIFMYPLVPLLGYAAYMRSRELAPLILAYTLPGAAIAAYHSYIQLAPSASCGSLACSTVNIRILWLSIPNQALLAFLLISSLVGVLVLQHDR